MIHVIYNADHSPTGRLATPGRGRVGLGDRLLASTSAGPPACPGRRPAVPHPVFLSVTSSLHAEYTYINMNDNYLGYYRYYNVFIIYS